MTQQASGPRFADEHELVVQREGVDSGPLMAFVISLVTLLAALVWGASLWFRASVDDVQREVAAEAVYPELQHVNIAAEERTGHYVALGEGRYQIPIERAIELLSGEYASDTNLTSEVRLLSAD